MHVFEVYVLPCLANGFLLVNATIHLMEVHERRDLKRKWDYCCFDWMTARSPQVVAQDSMAVYLPFFNKCVG